MIAITNISPGLNYNEEHEYRLNINYTTICTYKHRRSDGLAECLRKAAIAVENAKEKSHAERMHDFILNNKYN